MANDLRSLVRNGFTPRQALALQGEVAGVAQDNASGEGALCQLRHNQIWPDLQVSVAYPTAAGGRHQRMLVLPTITVAADDYVAGIRVTGTPVAGVTWTGKLFVSKVGGGTAHFLTPADQVISQYGNWAEYTLQDSNGVHGMVASPGGDLQSTSGGTYSIVAQFQVDLAY